MNTINPNPRVISAAVTDPGRRPNNEDFFAFFEPADPEERKNSGCIYIVADGVGGAAVGERASKYASEKVLYEYIHSSGEPAIRLRKAMIKANREIYDYADAKDMRMATTMTVAIIIESKLIVANVGDSRVYLIRGEEVRQITNDHNIVGEFVKDGKFTEEEALKSKAKNRLTRSIGGNDSVQVDVFDAVDLQPNDKLLLCTDGLTRYALKKDVAEITKKDRPDQIAKDAIDFVKKRGRGGADNISVLVVIYEPTYAFETTIQHKKNINPKEPWESMDTIVGLTPKKRMTSKQWSVIIFLSTILLAITGLTIFLLYPASIGKQELIPPLYYPNNPSSPTDTPIISAPTSPITSIPSTVSPLPSPTTTLTITQTLQTAETPTFTMSIIDCAYTVTLGDTLFAIAEKFGIGGNNYKDISCMDFSENSDCNVSNPASISPGWQVVIPGVQEATCLDNGGQIK